MDTFLLVLCFAAVPDLARTCTTSTDAPCVLTAPAVPTAPATTSALPQLGDADGPAHAATAVTADQPLFGDADGPAPAATAMTDTGA
jgi:hypothetical protein